MQLFLLRSRFFISIHALRVEGDLPEAPRRSKTSHFYPRPPGGGRRTDRPQAPGKAEFLSTPSGWRATSRRKRVEQSIKKFLSTPSGWRATLVVYDRVKTESDFYPRPPGGGRPKNAKLLKNRHQRFLSTPSGWRATRSAVKRSATARISIHALRVEGDSTHSKASITLYYFYPRPPGGGRRRGGFGKECEGAKFLSTPSGWRATRPKPAHGDWVIGISIHALRVEGDRACGDFCAGANHFYPRPPGGGRQQKRTKFSSVFAQKGEEFASLRRGKRKICRWRFKKDKFWVLIWCEGSGKSVCASASHCG